MPPTTDQLLLEIEATQMRCEWAKAQIEKGEAGSALLKFLDDSIRDLRKLKDTPGGNRLREILV